MVRPCGMVKQVRCHATLLAGLLEGERRGAARSRRKQAIAALSTLVGAVSMARAVNDKKLSEEILKAAADELKSHLALPSTQRRLRRHGA